MSFDFVEGASARARVCAVHICIRRQASFHSIRNWRKTIEQNVARLERETITSVLTIQCIELAWTAPLIGDTRNIWCERGHYPHRHQSTFFTYFDGDGGRSRPTLFLDSLILIEHEDENVYAYAISIDDLPRSSILNGWKLKYSLHRMSASLTDRWKHQQSITKSITTNENYYFWKEFCGWQMQSDAVCDTWKTFIDRRSNDSNGPRHSMQHSIQKWFIQLIGLRSNESIHYVQSRQVTGDWNEMRAFEHRIR